MIFICLRGCKATTVLLEFCQYPIFYCQFHSYIIKGMLPFLQDVTVIFRRRGGDDLVQNHADWVHTILSAPDVINITFLPIVSLLNGLPGIQNLSRAVDLYLECKCWFKSLLLLSVF